MAKRVRIGLIGAKGRMGLAIAELAADNEKIEIAAECDIGDSIEDVGSGADVIIDFSHAAATADVCRVAQNNGKPLVIGTTGHSPEQKKIVESAARDVPVVFASNFSVGVNVLFALGAKAADLLADDFDVRIVETHHTGKKDAPSGTAKTLADIIRTARQNDEAIPIESIREGEVVGNHTVCFTGPGERLEFTHRASSREIFARGALRAAEWIVGKPAGLYSMRDVLGL